MNSSTLPQQSRSKSGQCSDGRALIGLPALASSSKVFKHLLNIEPENSPIEVNETDHRLKLSRCWIGVFVRLFDETNSVFMQFMFHSSTSTLQQCVSTAWHKMSLCYNAMWMHSGKNSISYHSMAILSRKWVWNSWTSTKQNKIQGTEKSAFSNLVVHLILNESVWNQWPRNQWPLYCILNEMFSITNVLTSGSH